MLWLAPVVLSFWLASTSAQFGGINISAVPTCAQSCLANNTDAATGCSITDVKCLCQSTPFINAISCCIQQSCSTTDQQNALAFEIELCNNYSVSIPDFIGCSPLSTSLSYHAPASSTPAPTTLTGGLGTTMSLTSIVTRIASAFVATSGGPVADFTGRAIMTGSCTSPYIATSAMPTGGLLEYPWVGCSDQDPDCCPFAAGSQGPLTVCPHDYQTVSGACCPNGWAVYPSTIAGQLPCFTTPALPLIAPSTTGSGSTPSIISSQLFTYRYTLEPPAPVTLSSGAQAGIGVGAAAGALSVASIALCLIRRRRHAQAIRAATVPRSPYEAPLDFSPKTPASAHTFGQVATRSTPQTPAVSELPSPPLPISPSRSVFPQQQPVDAVATELPGSTFLHEHHPAYNRPGTPATNATDSSPPPASRVGIAVSSRDETYRPPFASLERLGSSKD